MALTPTQQCMPPCAACLRAGIATRPGSLDGHKSQPRLLLYKKPEVYSTFTASSVYDGACLENKRMLVLSLRTLVEQAVESFKAHQYTGNILSLDDFLREESISRLESQFDGLFAFLAFHPRIDQTIVDYIQAGSMASDSGSRILVLFLLDQPAQWPVPITKQSFGSWLELDTSVHPSYELVRTLFEGSTPPPLPGIAFFDRLSDLREPVFVGLQNLTTKEQIRTRLQTVCGLATTAYSKHGHRYDRFANDFCVELELQKVPYVRAGRTSMRSWLIKAFRVAWQHKGDIVSVVKLIK